MHRAYSGPVSSHTVAVLRLRDSSFVDRTGQLFVGSPDFVTLPFVDSSECNCGSSDRAAESREEFGSRVCDECVESWSCDWEVWLPAYR